MNYPTDFPSHWKRRSRKDDRFFVSLNSTGSKIWIRLPGGGLAFTIDREKLGDFIEQLKQFLKD